MLNRSLGLLVLFALTGSASISSSMGAEPAGKQAVSLLDSDPAELAVAVLLDDAWPSVDAAPRMRVQMTPKIPGAFASVDERLPFERVDAVVNARELGAIADGTRRQLFRFTAQSRDRFRAIQTMLRTLKASNVDGSKGGSMSIGVEVDNVVESANSAPAHARVETWMRTSQDEGFLKLWGSTAGELRRQIQQAQRGQPHR